MNGILRHLKVDKWIVEGAPTFWVLGISIILCGVVLTILLGLSLLLDWRSVTAALSYVFTALAAAFVVCVAWFIVDGLTTKDRPTTWRK